MSGVVKLHKEDVFSATECHKQMVMKHSESTHLVRHRLMTSTLQFLCANGGWLQDRDGVVVS